MIAKIKDDLEDKLTEQEVSEVLSLREASPEIELLTTSNFDNNDDFASVLKKNGKLRQSFLEKKVPLMTLVTYSAHQTRWRGFSAKLSVYILI